MNNSSLHLKPFLACLLILVSLAACEVSLDREQAPVDDRPEPEPLNEGYASILVEDPQLGFRLKPNSSLLVERDAGSHQVELRINSIGIRDREYSFEKPPGTIRVLFAGDSIVFGATVALENTIVKMLENGLNRRAAGEHRFQVMNWAVGSYCLRQELGWLEHADAARYQPDLLLVGTGPNDFGQSLEPNAFESQTSARPLQNAHGGSLGPDGATSRLYRLAPALLGRFDLSAPGARSRARLATSRRAISTREDLRSFRAYADSIDVALGIILFPGEALLDPQEPPSVQRAVYQVMVEEVARLGLPYLNCLPALRSAAQASPDSLFVARDGLHYNERGNRVISNQLIHFVRRHWYPTHRAANGAGDQ